MTKKTELEVDFDVLVKQINQKIAAAAKLLKEANALGKKAGLSCLTVDTPYACEDMGEEEYEEMSEKLSDISFSPLFAQLDAAGWSTSSLGC